LFLKLQSRCFFRETTRFFSFGVLEPKRGFAFQKQQEQFKQLLAGSPATKSEARSTKSETSSKAQIPSTYQSSGCPLTFNSSPTVGRGRLEVL
jgi:hypothetical protein